MTNCFPFAQGTRLAVSLLLAATSSHALAQVDDDPDGPAVVSRPVVQSTAPSPSRELNAALARLATDPRNVLALSDAAEAALKLGDSDAAIGFLTRADEVQPGNARTKALIGKAQLADENPVEAIRAFDDAERAGGDTFAMAAERALAYDLVGDNGRAQRWYQVALSRGTNDETTRRYAMSLAISGDRRGAEALLAPLIEKQDRAAWRTRTFAMAVTNGADEAVAIAYASMPQELASGIAPYLRFMPRLTPAQQAAAANFGRFPRAADMGRDDARVVQYAALNPRAPRGVEAGLIPAGAPLGPSTASASEKPSREKRRRPGRDDGKVAAAQVAPRTPAPATSVAQPSATQVARATPPVATPAPQRPTVLSALDVPPGTVRPPVPPIRRDVPASAVAIPAQSASAQSTLLQSTTAPVRTAASTPIQTPSSTSVAISNAPLGATQAQVGAAVPVQTPPRAQPSATTGFDLARVGGSTAGAASAPSPVAPAPPPAATTAAVPQATATLAATPSSAPVATPLTQPATSTVQLAQATPATNGAPPPANAAEPARPADFASMFKAFEPPAEERSATVAAVDITRLPPKPVAKADPRGERPDGPTDVSRTPAKEAEKPFAKDAKSVKDAKAKDAKAGDSKAAKDAKAKKAQPSHPSRIWVQVLTGANKTVMDNEWRRLVKEAPELLRSRKPYLSPWRSNFRLLTGPFESEASAQDFVTKLKKSGVSSYQWTSPAGQAVDTLALK